MNKATKYFILLLLTLVFTNAHSGTLTSVEDLFNNTNDIGAISKEEDPTKIDLDISESEFKSLARRHRIPTRKIVGLNNVKSGYYVIAGVFGQKNNARKFIGKLSANGLQPQLIFHEEKQLNYVFLAYHQRGDLAVNTCVSNLNGRYQDALWILQVVGKVPHIRPSYIGNKVETRKPQSLESLKREAKKYGIGHRVIHQLGGMKPGHYVIAGVYGQLSNARKQLARLRRQSLQPGLLQNPENQMYYLYLKKEADWQDAITGCINQLEGKYKEKLWILSVVNNTPQREANKLIPKKGVVQKREEISFHELATAKNISTRSESNFAGLAEGFYLVAGVFGSVENANNYLKRVRKKHPEARSVEHAQSKLNYVYVKYHSSGEQAIEDYLGGDYKDPLWILHIDPPQKPESEEQTAISSYPHRPELSSDGRFLKSITKKIKLTGNNDKLLEKADSYFDKMWYAEAAELYEMILNENPENQTFDIIRRAGDAHYFNTNMERAFHWYDILYNRYKSDMKADNLFKYAHALKGTGKYGRAKRLMRLYNKALKEEGSKRTYRPRPREAALDNILSTEEDYEIKNVGVNSEYSDFSPMFYQDNKVVYASAKDSAFLNTRRYKWNNQPYLDLYVAKINQESDEVRNAVKFSKKINTKYHEAAVTFSPDQKTIYFTRNNYGKKLKRDNKGINHLKIYMSKKVGDSWTEAVELPFNSDEYSTGHPALSPDGSKLYFVSDMPGSIGKTDLFVVDVLGDGQFSEPRNLGPDINTERREMFPFISDEKLYFSSDGHVGLGGLDIYESDISDEGFSEVRNMGQPLNSKRDDFSYIINEESQKGFFASNRRGGKGDDDIYSFKRILPDEPNENAISGVVTEMVTGEVMPKSLVILLDENNMKLKEMETDEDGSFVFEELESNTRYIIRTKQENYFEDEQTVTTVENEKVEVEIKLKRLEELIAIEDGIRKLKIDMIYFDFDKFNIRTDASEELDKLVEVMKTYSNMVIRIESHTDSRGKRAYNKYLSDKRAKSTRDYLISKGIDPKRIESAIGYGEERLLNECDGSVRCSSAKHQLNRRSEFIIVNM